MKSAFRFSLGVTSLGIAMFIATSPGCLRADVQNIETGPDAGAGGAQTGSGGTTGAGGATGAGGMTGAGGVNGMGGKTATGGSGAGGMGGMGGTAGTPGTGGKTGAGGAIVDAGSGALPSAAGQLIFTEIMVDTTAATDELGEWVEIYNPSLLVTYDLFNCQLYDSANADTVTRHVILKPGYSITLARSADPTLGFVPTDIYSTVKFSNTGDRAGLRCAGVTIDLVDFTTWAVPKGRSFSLNPLHYDGTANDALANWCLGTTVYNTLIDEGGVEMDYGSPGVTNPPCP